jgi:hypothetical protein
MNSANFACTEFSEVIVLLKLLAARKAVKENAPVGKLPSNGWQLSEWLNGLLITL